MMLSLASGLVLGLLLGVRNSLEPDHLAAVSVLVTQRGSRTAGVVLGAIWEMGHSLALLLVGCVLAVVGARLPARLANGFELLVAAMLVTLGTRAVIRAVIRTDLRADLRADLFSGDHRRQLGVSHNRWSIMRQPLIVGLIHGLAGSGALTALVLVSLPTIASRLFYILVFGIGSGVGMACLTGLAGWPLARLEADGRLSRWLLAATGTFSVLSGGFWGWSAIRGLIHA